MAMSAPFRVTLVVERNNAESFGNHWSACVHLEPTTSVFGPGVEFHLYLAEDEVGRPVEGDMIRIDSTHHEAHVSDFDACYRAYALGWTDMVKVT
jgi:hypothetical protein